MIGLISDYPVVSFVYSVDSRTDCHYTDGGDNKKDIVENYSIYVTDEDRDEVTEGRIGFGKVP